MAAIAEVPAYVQRKVQVEEEEKKNDDEEAQAPTATDEDKVIIDGLLKEVNDLTGSNKADDF